MRYQTDCWLLVVRLAIDWNLDGVGSSVVMWEIRKGDMVVLHDVGPFRG